MKTILVFKLPEDDFNYRMAQNGEDYYFLIKDILEHIREKLKYGQISDEKYKTLEEIQEKIYELANENKINLEIG